MLLEKVDRNSVNMHKMNPARVDREDERRMLPCRNFLDGFCPRGHRCRFYHPIPSSLPTVIRVPNLPSSFQQNTHFGQYPIHGGHHSVFSLSPRSSRSFMGLSPKLSTSGLGGFSSRGGGSSSRYISGMNGYSHGFGSRSVHVPVSPSYSEYEMAYAQEMELQKEKERRAAAPSTEAEEVMQNTVFSHIDWKEFLSPGARPPPPTHVPYMSNSPGKSACETMDSLESLIRSAGSAKITSPVNLSKPTTTFFEDRLAVPPQSEFGHPTVAYTRTRNAEKSPVRTQPPPTIKRDFSPPLQQIPSERVLSAKEELQLKVRQIAKELANEPLAHVQSLDTFFRNYTFQTVPTAPSSEQDLIGPSTSTLDDGMINVTQVICEDSEDTSPGNNDQQVSRPESQVDSATTPRRATITVFNPKVPAFRCSADSVLESVPAANGDSSSSIEISSASSNENPSPASS